MAWLIPVAGPFPDIADHVEKAIAIGRIAPHRRGPFKAILGGVLEGKGALPGIGHVATIGGEFVPPGEFGALQPAPRGIFPLGLRRQALARPARIGQRIGIGHMHHGMVVEPPDGRIRPKGMAPVRAEPEAPPLAPVFQRYRTGRRAEDEGSRPQHMGQGARIIPGVRLALGHGDMARGLHEGGELTIGHGGGVHPEAIHDNPVRGRLFDIVPVRSHAEGAAGDPDHCVFLRRVA